MDAAPSLVVAVPITEAPSFASAVAMALPSPRVAPVTSAICPERGPIVVISAPLRTERRERLVEAGAIVQCKGGNALVDAAGQSGQHLAGTAFDDVCDAASDERPHRVTPTHWTRRLTRQGIANGLRRRMLGDVDVVDHRDRRRHDIDIRKPRG